MMALKIHSEKEGYRKVIALEEHARKMLAVSKFGASLAVIRSSLPANLLTCIRLMM